MDIYTKIQPAKYNTKIFWRIWKKYAKNLIGFELWGSDIRLIMILRKKLHRANTMYMLEIKSIIINVEKMKKLINKRPT